MRATDDIRIDGKVTIVTGGAGGIGRAYCRALAEAGASVIVADLDGAGAQKVAGELESDGLPATAADVDITDVESVASMIDVARSAYGGVDVLVNNAAIIDMPYTPLATYPLDWWERGFRINVTGALICTQAVVPLMLERGGGKIINQSSSGAFTAAGAYGIGKLALVGLTVALAKELGPQGIHVNAIAPGMVDTEAALKSVPRTAPCASGCGRPRPSRRSANPRTSAAPFSFSPRLPATG